MNVERDAINCQRAKDGKDRPTKKQSETSWGDKPTFVLIGSDEDVDVVGEVALAEQLDRMLGQEEAVDGDGEREAEDAVVVLPLGGGQCAAIYLAHASHHLGRVGAD